MPALSACPGAGPRWRLAALTGASAIALLAACEDPVAVDPAPGAPEEAFADDASEPIAPLPREGPDVDPAHVELGRALWLDPLLSRGSEDDPRSHGEVTCNTCHPLDRGGADGLARSAAPDRPPSGVNVPTTFNLAYVFRFSWSGRFESLDDMLTAAMTSPAAMATTWEDAVARLDRSPEHRARFERAFADGVTEANLRAALRAYVLVQRTPDAPFDRFLRGETNAISPEAIEGYRLFREYGCASCHQGVNVGGNMYQRFGIMGDYFAARGGVEPADYGLWQHTGREEHRHVFRVPSLRNVALTAPYFHDGTAETLEEAVATMARYQLGRPLAPEHVASLVAFLRSLTGRLDDGPRVARRDPAPR